MKTTMTGAVLALALAVVAPAMAQNASQNHRSASLSDLASSYNVQPSEIQNLRDKGWSWNDIGKALAISKRSGQPLQELVAQKDSGMSWSQIADKNGFKLNEINRESKTLAQDFKRADKDARTGQAVRGAGEAMPSDQEQPSGAVSPETGAPGNSPNNTQAPSYPQSPNQQESTTPTAPNTTP